MMAFSSFLFFFAFSGLTEASPPADGACIARIAPLRESLSGCQLVWTDGVAMLRDEASQARQICQQNVGSGAAVDRSQGESRFSRCMSSYEAFERTTDGTERDYRRDCGVVLGQLNSMNAQSRNERQCQERLATMLRSLADIQQRTAERLKSASRELEQAKREAQAAIERYSREREQMQRAIRNTRERAADLEESSRKRELLSRQTGEVQAAGLLEESQRLAQEAAQRRALLTTGTTVRGNEIFADGVGDVVAQNGGASTISGYLANVDRLQQEQLNAQRFAENGREALLQMNSSFNERAAQLRSDAAQITRSAAQLGPARESSLGNPTAASRAPQPEGSPSQAPSAPGGTPPTPGSSVTSPPAMPPMPQASGGGASSGGGVPGPSLGPLRQGYDPLDDIRNEKGSAPHFGNRSNRVDPKRSEQVSGKDTHKDQGGVGTDHPLLVASSGSAVEGKELENGLPSNRSENRARRAPGSLVGAAPSFEGGRGSLGGPVLPLGVEAMDKARSDLMALSMGGGASDHGGMESLGEVEDLAALPGEEVSADAFGQKVDPSTENGAPSSILREKRKGADVLGLDSESLFQRVKNAHIRSAKGGRLLLGLKSKL